MAKLTLEGFAQEVSQALGKRLVSLLLYGSTARRPGVHVAGRGRADVNTLLICDAADENLFASLGPVVRRWVRAGHRAPLIFTEREWRESADAFPIEYADLREYLARIEDCREAGGAGDRNAGLEQIAARRVRMRGVPAVPAGEVDRAGCLRMTAAVREFPSWQIGSNHGTSSSVSKRLSPGVAGWSRSWSALALGGPPHGPISS